ncbi:hypothetical protein CCACVL1_07442 [Corchorus capsularis]|uniref:Transmembrane protein n=1 Tax=Corchorus capsularis TaxID=210143 RepID=A0A1R3J5X4_COCAP|nr:hypothetical protein CCACVL1_07442 [Corchorus capsularis]
MALMATQALLCNFNTHCRALPRRPTPFNSNPLSLPSCKDPSKTWPAISFSIPRARNPTPLNPTAIVCQASRRKSTAVTPTSEDGENDSVRRVLQLALWTAEAVYILWLFLLPYAPGDPVWAISSQTINDLIGLSLNFFFILPFMNAVGIRLIDAPVLHPMSEGLFNFVIGWTLMFAPLLYTDFKRDRYKGSLDVLWGFQMFLTNTFLIPYMAIRLNEADADGPPSKRSQLGSVMTNGAPIVGLIGGAVCVLSAIWALFGRMDGDFGSISDRWQFLESRVGLVNYLRFIPVVGLVAYLLLLEVEEEQ